MSNDFLCFCKSIHAFEKHTSFVWIYSLLQIHTMWYVETNKIMHGLEKVNADKFFKLADKDNARGHTLKIFKPRMVKGLCCRQEFFSQRVIESWNKLPDQVVNAVSINSFKSEHENYWNRYGVLKAST